MSQDNANQGFALGDANGHFLRMYGAHTEKR
jgi:hypothetical protein